MHVGLNGVPASAVTAQEAAGGTKALAAAVACGLLLWLAAIIVVLRSTL
jgi:hypothetical protein